MDSKRGAKSGNVELKPLVLMLRNFSIQKFLENISKPETAKLQKFYLDESNIYQHYVRHEDSI